MGPSTRQLELALISLSRTKLSRWILFSEIYRSRTKLANFTNFGNFGDFSDEKMEVNLKLRMKYDPNLNFRAEFGLYLYILIYFAKSP